MHDPSIPSSTVSRRAALVGLGTTGLALAGGARRGSAQDASPVARDHRENGHPLVGSWRWTNFPGTLMEDTTSAIFTATGDYVEAGGDRLIAPGIWRATGERTAELVLNPGTIIPLDAVFEPGFVLEDACLTVRDPMLFRIMIEVDEAGNHMTASGEVEAADGSGAAVQQTPYTGTGVRLVPVSDPPATPSADTPST